MGGSHLAQPNAKQSDLRNGSVKQSSVASRSWIITGVCGSASSEEREKTRFIGFTGHKDRLFTYTCRRSRQRMVSNRCGGDCARRGAKIPRSLLRRHILERDAGSPRQHICLPGRCHRCHLRAQPRRFGIRGILLRSKFPRHRVSAQAAPTKIISMYWPHRVSVHDFAP
jgi:hypothetical protein